MAEGEHGEHTQNSDRRSDHNSHSSSDEDEDDMEVNHESVGNYWLEYEDETPVSFTILPYFKEEENHDGFLKFNMENNVFRIPNTEKPVYLRGINNNGMSLYLKALSWKLELKEDTKPIFYLQAEKNWITLLKPRKSYEETIQSILIVAHFLNFALVYPDASDKGAWEHVQEWLPSLNMELSRDELLSHLPVIQHLISSNKLLATSTVLRLIDLGLSTKELMPATNEQSRRKQVFTSGGNNEGFIYHKDKKSKMEMGCLQSDEEIGGFGAAVEESDGELDTFGEDADVHQTGNGQDADVDQNRNGEDGDIDRTGDLSETVCCICDNGGEVTSCDGPCMRSFHVHKDAQGAEDVSCSTLGFSKSKVQSMDKFYCPNCEAKVHQCNACGELGRSHETIGAAQEVFLCETAMCGRFYHPTCIAEITLRDHDKSEQTALAESIKKGEGFSCSMHKCWKCGIGEKEERDLQFGICRRCPRVWHRACLPSSILFDNESDDERGEDEPTRAWDGLLLNRILIYCNRHPIISKLGTPERSHVKFPASYKFTPKRTLGKNKLEQVETDVKLSKIVSLKRSQSNLKPTVERKVSKTSEGDATSPQKKLMKGSQTVFVLKGLGSPANEDDNLHESGVSAMQSKSKAGLDGTCNSTNEATLHQHLQKNKPPTFRKSVIISSEIQNVVDTIIGKAKAVVTIESVLNKYDVPINYRRLNSKNADRKYSLVKIESITKGMRKALEILENGGSIEDAKMKCSPHFIKYLELCRNDLRVYLSPFLYGARYTSYGRHFTKTDKLEQIADRLHAYVDEGDMVVDFCCGSNEFSLLMKEKLEESGKICKYKNFDAIQTKNDFNFTKKDWFKVKPEDLIDGSRLIMGLNPPFGVRGALANQFINHALKFKPKLLVFIVPKETERLDRKPEKYELVWEDPDLLQGKSFYLPGSIDVDENPLTDWNVVAPPLYLWSRPDWASRHRQVALEKGHISTESDTWFTGMPSIPRQQPCSPLSISDSLIEKRNKTGGKIMESVLDEKGKTFTNLHSAQENSQDVSRRSLSKLKDMNSVDSKFRLRSDSNAVANEEALKFNVNGRTSSSKLMNTQKVGTKFLLPNKLYDAANKDALKFKVTSMNEPISKDSSENLPLPEIRKTIEHPSIVDQEVTHMIFLSKESRKEDSSKQKTSEEKDLHSRRVDGKRLSSWQEPTEKARLSLDSGHNISLEGRKSSDGFDREARSNHGLLPIFYRKASVKHWPKNDGVLLGGRISPNRHGRHETSRRTADRSERKDTCISDFTKLRKISSPERSHRRTLSSVVDLDMYSSRDAQNDQDRDYMKTTGRESRRQISPGRRYSQEVLEPDNLSYFDQGVMRHETFNAHSVDGQRRGLENPSRRSGRRDDVYLRGHYGHEYGPISGQSNKVVHERRGTLSCNDNYLELPIGDMYRGQVDGYRSHYNAASVLPQQNQSLSHRGRDWPISVPQHSSNYHSFIPNPPGDHIVGLNHSDSLLGARPPMNLSQYPPPGQTPRYQRR